VTIIADIESILNAAASRKEPIGLTELLWTIDARYHAIPTLDEIASARLNAPSLQIERSAGVIRLLPNANGSFEALTEQDIEVSMQRYRELLKTVKE
jgi:hypothetical protein